jgi:hypothetical protein
VERLHVAFFDRLAGLLLDHEVVTWERSSVPMVACQLTAAYWEGNGSTVPSDIWLCWSSAEDLRIFQLSAGGGFLPGIGEFGDQAEDLSDSTLAAIREAAAAVCRGDYRYCVEGMPQ